MSNTENLDHLLSWLRNFDVASAVANVDDISDGFIIGQVLSAISPKNFTPELLARLNVGSDINRHLKVNNLRKILKWMLEFLNEVPDEPIRVNTEPDVSRIVSHQDEEAAFRLLQLVLVCAVNCETKATYIEAIMKMEQTVQHALMEAIKQLMSANRLHSNDMPLSPTEEPLREAIGSHQNLLSVNESLAQKCHELEKKLVVLTQEKSALRLENEMLLSTRKPAMDQEPLSHRIPDEPLGYNAAITGKVLGEPVPYSPTAANVRISQLQDQLTKLRNELYCVETLKEELNIKLENAVNLNKELKQKCEVLSNQANEALMLKDELDIARAGLEASERLPQALEQLRKRTTEVAELRARCTQLESDNNVCVQRLSELEQDARLSAHVRSQVETHRLEAVSAREEADEAVQRADKAEIELMQIKQDISTAIREKTHLITELNRLRSCCEELQSCVSVSPQGTLCDSTQMLPSGDQSGLSPAIQSRMHDLCEELTRLRTSVPPTSDFPKLDEQFSLSIEEPPQIPASGTEYAEVDKVVKLQQSLTESEKRFTEMEQQYRGYLWKAREVIRLMEQQRRCHESACSMSTGSTASEHNQTEEVVRLRALLVEKESVIEKLEQHHDRMRLQRDTEERMLIAAWYNLNSERTRQLVEQNIRKLSSGDMAAHSQTNASPSGTDYVPSERAAFLTRQREIHLRPPRGLTSIVTAMK